MFEQVEHRDVCSNSVFIRRVQKLFLSMSIYSRQFLLHVGTVMDQDRLNHIIQENVNPYVIVDGHVLTSMFVVLP